ncbi:MAG TPA: hypothetical protein VGL56_13985, partial [Fimbriimonadaceae bacterium]
VKISHLGIPAATNLSRMERSVSPRTGRGASRKPWKLSLEDLILTPMRVMGDEQPPMTKGSKY